MEEEQIWAFSFGLQIMRINKKLTTSTFNETMSFMFGRRVSHTDTHGSLITDVTV